MKEAKMRKDSFWFREAALKMQAIDTKRVLIMIETEKEDRMEKMLGHFRKDTKK